MRLSGLAIAQVFISVLYLVVQNAIKERKKERKERKLLVVLIHFEPHFSVDAARNEICSRCAEDGPLWITACLFVCLFVCDRECRFLQL
jgi:hypothetical protein